MTPSRTQDADHDLYEIHYPRGRSRTAEALRPARSLGLPAAVLYRFVSGAIRSRRIARRPSLWNDVTVLSVGNLEIGGGGKTPFAVHLLQYLERNGKTPVYVSRGFGSTAETLAAVTVRASWTGGRCPASPEALRLISADGPARADQIGDEGAMVAGRCSKTPLLFSHDKVRAIEVAREMFQPTHVVLDDAFQSWAVPRHRDIVLLDAKRPLGNGRLVPAGTLREDPAALVRADCIGINGCDAAAPPGRYAELVGRVCGRTPPVFGVVRKVVLVDPREAGMVERIYGAVAALSSIARPAGFERALLGNGGTLELALRFPDHHRYRRSDLAAVTRLLRARGITTLVTTEKDWVKLREFDLSFARVLIGRLELSVEESVLREITKEPRSATAALS